MGPSVCPSAVVAVPVECVWSLLDDPLQWGRWADARVESVEPPGSAHSGQVALLSASGWIGNDGGIALADCLPALVDGVS